MRANSPTALTKSPDLTLEPRTSRQASNGQLVHRLAQPRDWPRRVFASSAPRFPRRRSSGSKTAPEKCRGKPGVTRNSLAPHWVSKMRTPNASEAVIGEHPAQAIAAARCARCDDPTAASACRSPLRSSAGRRARGRRARCRQAAWPNRRPKSRRSRRPGDRHQHALPHGLGLAAVDLGQVQEAEAARIGWLQMLDQLERFVAAAVVDEQQLDVLGAASKVLDGRACSAAWLRCNTARRRSREAWRTSLSWRACAGRGFVPAQSLADAAHGASRASVAVLGLSVYRGTPGRGARALRDEPSRRGAC